MIHPGPVARVFAFLVLAGLAAFAGETTTGTVTFSEPSDGAVVGSTFHLLASGSAEDPVYGITVYVNGRKTASSAGSVLDASLSGVSGRTRVTVQAFNKRGHFQKTIYVSAVAVASRSSSDTSGESDSSAPASPSSSTSGSGGSGSGSSGIGSSGDRGSGGNGSGSSNSGGSSPDAGAPAAGASGAGSGGGLPGSAKIFRNVERSAGWESCTVCAGPGGNGGVADYSMRPNVSSPSMDGHSAEFNLGGKRPYADALWWKQLGPDASAHHFVYDVYFYIDKPEVSQALEFDVNQSTGGKKYIFGTECSLGRGMWDVWAADRSWIRTTVPCGKPAAYTWHHLIWEFERTPDNKVKYVAVTLDGVKHYLNQTYGPKPSHSQEINVAFQMDGNRQQSGYSVWLNKVQLSYW